MLKENSYIKICKQAFKDSISLKNNILNSNIHESIVEMSEQISDAIVNGNKLMICGNGGSAADAQHLAAELLVRLKPHNNREGIPAISLAMDSSTITACGNDFGYDQLFKRMVETLGKPGDVLLCITTSGKSLNINLALEAANKINIETFSFLGSGGGQALDLSKKYILIPSEDTARIQECHILIGHLLMDLIERQLIAKNHIQIFDK